MTYDNYNIADQFAMLAKLMDIHGENSFKSKSYSIAAFNIEKIPVQLSTVETSKISSLKGIGDSSAKKIIEILETGKLQALEEIILKTPPGVAEMLNIKGLGPKKIATVWKEMGIESIGELLYACNENRLTLYKGFGEKTQKNVQEAIEFYFRSQGNYLYAEVEEHTRKMEKALANKFPSELFAITGSFRRQLEIITELEWVTTADDGQLKSFFNSIGYTEVGSEKNKYQFTGPENILLSFYLSDRSNFFHTLFDTSSSEEFKDAWDQLSGGVSLEGIQSEEDMFTRNGLQVVPACLREKESIIDSAKNNSLPELIQPGDIKGIIHSHSNWSDGSDTIEEMAKSAINLGLEYLVISDHSKSAFYANGLQEDRIREQHAYIDELNAKFAPFKIFKSIESDILNDGSLDYSDQVLASFDLVIASIHTNLKMSLEKAMMRLMKAIQNPFTTIVGHMTGRLLLSRPGYPLDYPEIINACAANQVTIELNAHPRRLDMDWRWIDSAIANKVLISIDPDAHSVEGYKDCRYGVLAAQKAGVTKADNLSSFSLQEFESFLQKRKSVKAI
jgi:DNA polymerase (family 10)